MTYEDRTSYVYISGTPKTAGSYESYVKATDELGNVFVKNINISVYSNDVRVGEKYTLYLLENSGYTSMTPTFNGGSSTYTYKINREKTTLPAENVEMKDSPNSEGMSSKATIKYKATAPGTYKIVVDCYDYLTSQVCSSSIITVNVTATKVVSGYVFDGEGHPLEDACVSFESADRGNRYLSYGSIGDETASNGFFSLKVPDGKYDVHVSYSEYGYNSSPTASFAKDSKSLDDVEITEDKSLGNFKLNLFKVNISIDDKTDPAINYTPNEWYCGDYFVGNGSSVYMKPGTYELRSANSLIKADVSYTGSTFVATGWTMSYKKTDSVYRTSSFTITDKEVSVSALGTLEGEPVSHTISVKQDTIPEMLINEEATLPFIKSTATDPKEVQNYYGMVKFVPSETGKYKMLVNMDRNGSNSFKVFESTNTETPLSGMTSYTYDNNLSRYIFTLDLTKGKTYYFGYLDGSYHNSVSTGYDRKIKIEKDTSSN